MSDEHIYAELKRLMETMIEKAEFAPLLHKSLSCVADMASSSENVDSIVELGGIDQCIDALVKHADKPRILEEVSRIFASIMRKHPEYADIIGEKGGVELAVAALRDHPDTMGISACNMLLALTKAPANIKRIVDGDGITAILATMQSKNKELAEKSTRLGEMTFKESESNASLEASHAKQGTAAPAAVTSEELREAARNGKLAKLETLLETATKDVINGGDLGGSTALHWAARNGQTASLEVLLLKGADIKAKNKYGETALHLAAREGKTASLEALLAKGADIEAKDEGGSTALHWAAGNRKTACLDALLAKGADIKAKNNEGRTALHHAALYGQTACLEALLAKGADIEAKDNEGKTALDAANQWNKAGVVRVLEAWLAKTKGGPAAKKPVPAPAPKPLPPTPPRHRPSSASGSSLPPPPSPQPSSSSSSSSSSSAGLPSVRDLMAQVRDDLRRELRRELQAEAKQQQQQQQQAGAAQSGVDVEAKLVGLQARLEALSEQWAQAGQDAAGQRAADQQRRQSELQALQAQIDGAKRERQQQGANTAALTLRVQVLEEDYRRRRQKAIDQELLQESPVLWVFYNTFQAKMSEFVIGQRALQSGLVQAASSTRDETTSTVKKLAVQEAAKAAVKHSLAGRLVTGAITLAGELILIPGARAAAGLLKGCLGKGIKWLNRHEDAQEELVDGLAGAAADKLSLKDKDDDDDDDGGGGGLVAALGPTVMRTEIACELVARALAFRFENQVRQMTQSGASVFAQVCVWRLIQWSASSSSSPSARVPELSEKEAGAGGMDLAYGDDGGFVATLLAGIASHRQAGPGRLGKLLRTTETKRQWSPHDVLDGAGIQTRSNDYWDMRNQNGGGSGKEEANNKVCRAGRYGYRSGHEREVKAFGKRAVRLDGPFGAPLPLRDGAGDVSRSQQRERERQAEKQRALEQKQERIEKTLAAVAGAGAAGAGASAKKVHKYAKQLDGSIMCEWCCADRKEDAPGCRLPQ